MLLTVKFVPNSNNIVSGGFDRKLSIFNYKTGELVKIMSAHK